MTPPDTIRALATKLTSARVALRHQHLNLAFQAHSALCTDVGAAVGRYGANLEINVLRDEVERLGRELLRALLPGEPADPRIVTAEIAAGIRVLRERDGLAVTEEQIAERSRNIAGGLLGAYRIRTA